MTVYLVGAGPGDPGLITVRGAELLGMAEVVIHDRLSAVELLELCSEGTILVNVGKTPGGPTVPQETVNELLVQYGRSHSVVVRLKGGDPFVFARGAEEMAVLIEADIPAEVVPGITSALAVPAYGGVPATRRFSATSFTVVTGHTDPRTDAPAVRWDHIAKVGGTIIILMGVANIAEISTALIAGGLSPSTPVAAIRWGTRPQQQTTRCTLGDLVSRPLMAPSVIVVGEVAAENLNWFEQRPLFGRRILVTRPTEGASRLAGRLRDLGAEVVSLPSMTVTEPADGGVGLARLAAEVAPGDWVVLSSRIAAQRFLASLADLRSLGGIQLAVVGPGTAEVVIQAGMTPDLVPAVTTAEGLLGSFPSATQTERSVVWLPQSSLAPPVLSEGIAARGWEVRVVEAYGMVRAESWPDPHEILEGIDAVTCMSSSAAAAVHAAVGSERLAGKCYSIGPSTSATLVELGVQPVATAEHASLDGMVECLVWAFGESDPQE